MSISTHQQLNALLDWREAERLRVVEALADRYRHCASRQETGLLHKALAAGAQHAPDLLDPLGPMTGLAGMIKDQRILGRLDAMQQTLGGLQLLQVAALATSVVGIGVTVAGTALMLRRLNDVDGAVGRVEAKLDDLPRKWTEGKMRDRIRALGTAFSRIDEAGARRNPGAVMKDAERDLHHDFDALYGGRR